MQRRLIGLWHHEAQVHRIYITSASSELLAGETAAAVYAMRWEIELLTTTRSVYGARMRLRQASKGPHYFGS